VKVSYFCLAPYASPELLSVPRGWPLSPALYDPEIGLRSIDNALEQAATAEELGFDWISASEHHYYPL
jgi:alkanesulfonate monooxygenase SsuD/methylene tetrahydromethanopterin reductase-like flavin-dependent oxidoreductase (luciferase family)